MISVMVVWSDGESVEFDFEVYSVGEDITPTQDLQRLKDDIKGALQEGSSIVLDSHIVPLTDIRYVSVGFDE